MQHDDELIEQMKRWGHAQVNRHAWRERHDDEHVLARQRAMAPGTKQKVEVELVGRDGEARRRLMAAGANAGLPAGRTTGIHILPTWAVDPIRSRDDGDAPHDRESAAVDMGIPDDLRWIDNVLLQIERQHPLRALCLREEYCGVGSQSEKASRVARQYKGKLSVWMYRRELQRAHDWLRAKAA